ncbi:MAG: extracellular solute-binding protein [Propionibacteriales bacterium]|nr:extracellular solute-binding protein [Propionibacteriales bacterium]
MSHHPTFADSRLTRRSLIKGTIGLAAGAATLSTAACSGSTATSGGEARASTAVLPSYRAGVGPAPDLAPVLPGAPAGFLSYPSSVAPSVSAPPMKGGTVQIMTNVLQALPTERSANTAWQGIERGLGGTLDLIMVPGSDYAQRFQTTLASGGLPDITLFDDAAIDDIPAFMDKVCADLSPYLSGDAILKFPNLAAIPTIVWQDCVTVDKIYQIPIPRGLTAGAGFYNKSLLDRAGVQVPADAADFEAFLTELNRPQDGTWAIVNMSNHPFFSYMLCQMLGSPYNWRKNDDGTLTRSFETEEYKLAMEWAARFVKLGLTVPGSDALDGIARANAFKQGKGALVYDGLPAFPQYLDAMPDAEVTPFVPMGLNGAPPVTAYDNTSYGTVVLKKAEEGRIRELLGVLNYLAAPFGTSEYELLIYGEEGAQFTKDGEGNPVLTDKGVRDMSLPLRWVTGPAFAIYNRDREYVRRYHAAANKMISTAVQDPTGMLISPTSNKRASAIAQPLTDLRNDIIAGRQQLSAWDVGVETWRKDGGNQIREEYQQALAGTPATPR